MIRPLSCDQVRALKKLNVTLPDNNALAWLYYDGPVWNGPDSGEYQLELDTYSRDYPWEEPDMPTLTVEEILDMLPEIEPGCEVILNKSFRHNTWSCIYINVAELSVIHDESGTTQIDAAYNMLKWVAQNHHDKL